MATRNQKCPECDNYVTNLPRHKKRKRCEPYKEKKNTYPHKKKEKK